MTEMNIICSVAHNRALDKRTKADSLCWDCKNAYANKCAWLGKGEKVWDDAREEVRRAGNSAEFTVQIVTDCCHFEPDEPEDGDKIWP